MILQALYDYYHRKAADPASQIAPEGWERKELPFLVVIDEEGKFKALQDTREGEGKKRRSGRFLVPQGEKRANNIKACLLWDNVEYALGANPRGRNDVVERHEAFKNKIQEDLKSFCSDMPIKAVLDFLENDPIKQIEGNANSAEAWKEAQGSNAFVSFRLDGSEDATICDTLRRKLSEQNRNLSEQTTSPGTQRMGLCLVTGKTAPIARLHPSIKGVWGTNTSGAALVSFNLPAFASYGKQQNYNAPLGASASFAYTTALNLLLGKDSQNKTSVGDATTVFWAQQRPAVEKYDMEQDFAWYVADPPKDDPDKGVRAVKALYKATKEGHLPSGSDDRFYVLSLAPNAARIAVRFWRTGTVQGMAEKITKHFDDVAIICGPKEPEYLTLNQMLRATALEYKMDNVPPNMAGMVMASILDGTPYPRTLLQQCVRRVRAERQVNRTRAAILKGCLNRSAKNMNREVLLVGLDRTNGNIGYRLGRLFAVLEKIQEEANPGINATIRDRFYGAASSSPVAVFSQLLKLKNHHLSKLSSPGRRVNFEKKLGDIFDGINEFPAHLSLDEQAYFAVGYYHQRQDFFGNSEKNAE